MMIPESTTPSVAPSTVIPPHAPIAFARSVASGNSSTTSESAAGAASASPSPCAKREMTSIAEVCARPLVVEATANRTVPMMNIRRRPTMSAMRPPTIRKPPATRV